MKKQTNTSKTLKIHAADNVVVALNNLQAGEVVTIPEPISILQDVSQKHKIAITDLKKGEKVIQYGVIVGEVISDVKKGDVITTRNIVNAVEEEIKPNDKQYNWYPPDVSRFKNRTFNGFVRENGKAGTANYWIFVPLVFCENRNLMVIKDALNRALGYNKPDKYLSYTHSLLNNDGNVNEIFIQTEKVFPNISGIKFLTHHGGCGGTREDAEILVRLLAGYIHHPNVAGATVLSLGCQNAQVEILQKAEKALYGHTSKPVFYFEQQKEKSEEQLIKKAIKATISSLKQLNKTGRESVSVDQLIIGVECGGSDGFSGISANPVIGHVSDMLVALGGTTILSEFPELHGIEQELVNRCVSATIAEKFLKIQQAYYTRARAIGSGFDMNPSPGNIRDGLITDAIKSAGAAKKGGTSPVTDVLDYTEPVIKKGLNLLCTPGNDVESTTGMVGSGANLILFSTGLGTPTGNPIAPVIKISSNTQLFQRMPDIIDFDAGGIISGQYSIEALGEKLFELVLKVAGGEVETKAMTLEQDDFIPWKRGVSL